MTWFVTFFHSIMLLKLFLVIRNFSLELQRRKRLWERKSMWERERESLQFGICHYFAINVTSSITFPVLRKFVSLSCRLKLKLKTLKKNILQNMEKKRMFGIVVNWIIVFKDILSFFCSFGKASYEIRSIDKAIEEHSLEGKGHCIIGRKKGNLVKIIDDYLLHLETNTHSHTHTWLNYRLWQ